MNVFYTNKDPKIAAREHCKVHRNKMIVEYAQLLSTAHRLLNGMDVEIYVPNPKGEPKLRKWRHHFTDTLVASEVSGYDILTSKKIYACTHANHPSAVWVRQNHKHYDWVRSCALELTNMFWEDGGQEHATRRMLQSDLRHAPFDLQFNDEPFVEPPLAMPDEHKFLAILKGDHTVGYQDYLNAKFREWKSRERPMKVEFLSDAPEWYKA